MKKKFVIGYVVYVGDAYTPTYERIIPLNHNFRKILLCIDKDWQKYGMTPIPISVVESANRLIEKGDTIIYCKILDEYVVDVNVA